jgi:hypothetical protein
MLLRVALVLMTSDSHNMTRGESSRRKYVYQCPNGHIRRMPRYELRPVLCKQKECGLPMKFVPRPDKP